MSEPVRLSLPTRQQRAWYAFVEGEWELIGDINRALVKFAGERCFCSSLFRDIYEVHRWIEVDVDSTSEFVWSEVLKQHVRIGRSLKWQAPK